MIRNIIVKAGIGFLILVLVATNTQIVVAANNNGNPGSNTPNGNNGNHNGEGNGNQDEEQGNPGNNTPNGNNGNHNGDDEEPEEPEEPSFATLNPTCNVNATSITLGTSVQWTVQISGGQAPYEVLWAGDESLTGNGDAVTITYTTPGVKTSTVTVASNDGQFIQRVCPTVTVSEASSPEPTPTPETPTEEGTPRPGGHRHSGSSSSSGGQVLGASIGPAGEVLGASCNAFITSSIIRPGGNHNVEEIKQLQHFLNLVLGTTLEENGVYNAATIDAVNKLQLTFSQFILKPWVDAGLLPNEQTPTGIVYKTTARFINSMSCPSQNIPMPMLP
jgi:PKD repeat protein